MPVICVMGPTGVGKSAWAMLLARRLRTKVPCEIISADSVMVYKDLDIGSAKPSTAQLKEIPHHLVSMRSVQQGYSAADFRADAIELIRSLRARGVLPVVVGGSMFYFHALRYGIASLPATSEQVRIGVQEQAGRLGWAQMHRRLQQVDPKSAAAIHPHHSARIARALEVYDMTGVPMSACRQRVLPGLEQLGISTRYTALLPGPWPISGKERKHSLAWQAFEARLRLRIEGMFAAGLLTECANAFYGVQRGIKRSLPQPLTLPAARAVGYRQILEAAHAHSVSPHLLARNSDIRKSLLDKIMSATRRAVRSQLTWLGRFPELRPIVLKHAVDAQSREELPSLV
jgi:tRNA dimethylallyltransferase